MVSIVLLVAFSLLHLYKAEVTPLFVQTGKDLLLEVKEAVTLGENDQIIWSVNGSKDIARFGNTDKPIIFKSHSERAVVFPQNQSLLLRSLTKSDNGVYKARVFGDQRKEIEYKVIVLDPVSPVNLTVTNCSSDSSNLTVTCSPQDSPISRTFTCDDQSCSEERGERAEFTTPAASLKVYLEGDSVTCVHSNQVSRTEDVRKVQDFCRGNSDFKHRKTVVTKIIVPIFLFIVIIIVAVFLYHRKKRKSDQRKGTENTVYEVPRVADKAEPPEQRPKDDASPAGPTTVYSYLKNPTVTEASPEAGRKTLPESLYASVQKAEKS